MDNAGGDVDVTPLKAADLADSQTGVQADEDTEVAKGKVALEVLQERLLLGPGEDLQAVGLLCGGGKMNLEFRVQPGAGLLAVTQNHFQNRQ